MLFKGFSCCGAWALGHAGSVVVVHGLSCSTSCRIFLDQGSNLCLLHWQVDSTESPGKPSHEVLGVMSYVAIGSLELHCGMWEYLAPITLTTCCKCHCFREAFPDHLSTLAPIPSLYPVLSYFKIILCYYWK